MSRSASISSPAGIPSISAMRPFPWDSPAVVNFNCMRFRPLREGAVAGAGRRTAEAARPWPSRAWTITSFPTAVTRGHGHGSLEPASTLLESWRAISNDVRRHHDQQVTLVLPLGLLAEESAQHREIHQERDTGAHLQ